MATHTSILAWRIPWTGEPGGLQSMLITTFIYNSQDMKATSVQFSSVAQSCPTLCDPMNRSTADFPVCHQLQEFTQTYVH